MEATIGSTQQAGVHYTEQIEAYADMLTPDALVFLTRLHRRFQAARRILLRERMIREQKIDQGLQPTFCINTTQTRQQDWTASPTPADLQNRQIEITAPVDRRMIINALNSGANIFMADFGDATSPTWDNELQGQRNLYDAIRRQIDFVADTGKEYTLNDHVAVLTVRPRGWHLDERHLIIDGEAMSASLFDFGLYFFHNANELLKRGSGPYFYLPKLEGRFEARLWNDVFVFAEDYMNLSVGTIKATVLIESVLAAFEMHEIIFELREHIVGLNAGRWDYIFSFIKKFKTRSTYVFPDRSQVTMRAPFMRAYAQLLVQTCHRRGIHAIGGMSALIPNRRDPAANANAFAHVKEDKELEVVTGFDGTWVAHPDLVAVAREPFRQVLGDAPHQKHELLSGLKITDRDLLNPFIPNGTITEAGLRMNIKVGILYLESWLRGIGAVAIDKLMEDAATAEISRAQVWQWLQNGVRTYNGQKIELGWYKKVLNEEVESIQQQMGNTAFQKGRFYDAILIFDRLATSTRFEQFLTSRAYDQL